MPVIPPHWEFEPIVGNLMIQQDVVQKGNIFRKAGAQHTGKGLGFNSPIMKKKISLVLKVS